MTPDMAVVTPLNNFLGPEGDTVTVDEQLLNTEYLKPCIPVYLANDAGHIALHLPQS